MRSRNLTERVEALLQEATVAAARSPSLAPLSSAAAAIRKRITGPMRVAVVGKIKAGKSTFMNALIGEPVLATGGVETTFNVSWLTHATSPGVVVHYKDGRPPEPRPFADLHAVTRLAAESRDALMAIRHVEVRYPAPVLREMELIDTPGLESVHTDDSDNTRRFLNLYGSEMTDRTVREASSADATLYLFSHGLSARDEDVLLDLQGAALGRATPLNSVAVLTKVDAYWPDATDPLAAGREVTDRLVARFPRLRQLFYLLRPACGALGLGAQSVTEREYAVLGRLANLPVTVTDRLFADVRRLCERELPEVPVPPAERVHLWEKLGRCRFGLWEGCRLLRSGAAPDLSRLRAGLLAASGIGELRNRLLAHFGNRAYLIKLVRGFEELKDVCFGLRRTLPTGSDRDTIGRFAAAVEEIELTDPAFAELAALHAYYSGEVELDPEMSRELLDGLGEHGTTPAARVGSPEITSPTEVARIAMERSLRWRRFLNDTPGLSPRVSAVCRTVAGVYGRLAVG